MKQLSSAIKKIKNYRNKLVLAILKKYSFEYLSVYIKRVWSKEETSLYV